MDYVAEFVGLDISKDKITVAVADPETGSARYGGASPNTFDAVCKRL